jgi:prephenate dehydratase/prephenate dehydrogenase
MKISIIGGRGAMGRLFEKILLSKGHDVEILGRNNYSKLNKIIKWSDIIIISVPLDCASNVINDISKTVSSDKIVIDFSSVMQPNLEAMKKLNCNCGFVHPLFGPDISSLKNLNIVIVPVKGNLNKFTNFLQEEDASIIKSSVKEHDKIMSVVQGLTHFNNMVFAKTLIDIKIPHTKFYTTLFNMEKNMLDRMFSQLAHVSANIQFLNKYTKKSIEIYHKNFEKIKNIINNNDKESFIDEFNKISSEMSVQNQNNTIKIKKRIFNKNSLAVLGPRGSFTDAAASLLNLNKVYFDSISEIIKAVKDKKIKLGIIPIENSIHGTVVESLDGINHSNVKIIKAIIMPIHHCIATLPNHSTINTILSHPQALMQCSEYIKKNYPNAKLINTLSTTEAFQEVKEKQLLNAAVIGPTIATQIYGLDILKEDIENEKQNKTKFVVISTSYKNTGLKTSLVVIPNNEKQGILFNMLKYFAEEKINLTKIESRPLKNELGKYIFYIDIDGDVKDKKVKKAIKSISNNIGSIKILGSYNEIRK